MGFHRQFESILKRKYITSQSDFDCDVKGSVRSIYPTLLSHTAEPYPTLPVMGIGISFYDKIRQSGHVNVEGVCENQTLSFFLYNSVII